MNAAQLIFLTAIAMFTTTAAAWDLKTRRLPNWLTVSAFVAGVAWHSIFGGLGGLYFSLLGFITGFGILFLLWIFGGGGGGDVKLMGALGAWLGMQLIVGVFLVSAVVIVFAVMVNMSFAFTSRGFRFVKRRYMSVDWRRPGMQKRDDKWVKDRQRTRILPYAVPVAISTWLVLLAVWMASDSPV